MKQYSLKQRFLLIQAFLLFFLVLESGAYLSESKTKHNQSNLMDVYEEKITKNQRLIDVIHYDLFFDLFPDDKKLVASAKITVAILKYGLKVIDFNFYDDLVVQNVLLNKNSESYNHDDNILSIYPKTILKQDTITIEINYSGTPKSMGLSGFVFGRINGRSLVYTLSEPDFASTWFPCNDFPDDKALVDMRIKNDSSCISVSNGKLIEVKTYGNRKTYYWKTEYQISTYLVALYSANYTHFTDSYISLDDRDTMTIEYYVLPDKLEKAKIDFKEHPDIIRFFAEVFGEYPFIDEKYGVAQFLWQSGAMENQTITGVASNLISGNNYYLDYYVHELAHHWWGNAIGPKYWKDIWLNEGFSTYCEALYSEFRSGKSSLRSTMLNKKYGHFSGKLSEPGSDLFTSTIYNKGAWLMHMLRFEVGKKNFFNILREYFEKYKYSNASTENFIDICEDVSGKDLSKFFDQWLNGEGEIELDYFWETNKTKRGFITNIFVEQRQNGYDEYHFPLEIKFVVDNDNIDTVRYQVSSINSRFEYLSENRPVKIILDPDNWLLMISNYESDN